MKNLTIKLAVPALAFATLACGVQVVGSNQSPAPSNPSPVSAPVPSGWTEFTVLGDVNIRSCANASCPSVGVLHRNEIVRAKCEQDWCQVENGYVWAGCLIGGKCQSK